TEENAFRRSALMRGNHVPVPEDALHRIAEPIKTPAARVAFVALHDGRPLVCGHGAGPRIREKINQNFVGWQEEQVVMGHPQRALTFLPRGPMKRLNALDPEGLNDG